MRFITQCGTRSIELPMNNSALIENVGDDIGHTEHDNTIIVVPDDIFDGIRHMLIS